MSKVITSPVPRWPGDILLYDPLTEPQCAAIERALVDAEARSKAEPPPTRSELDGILVPAVLLCVEKNDLTNWPGYFPATPKVSSAKLLAWLLEEILSLYKEADEIPNA